MPQSLTHKYFPRVEQREPNLFIEEYYSGTDTKIYIDDVEQTEISYINYTLQEQLKPLYGYASRTFDDVAVGNRIVTGMIKVPIKNPEAQTQLVDILAFAKNDPTYNKGNSTGEDENIDDYNQTEEDLKNAVEWINNSLQQIQNSDTNVNLSPSYVEESEKEFNYRSKLIELGYDLDYGSSKEAFKAQIYKFQQDHGLDWNGDLDEYTTDKIDDLIAEKWGQYSSIPLEVGTRIYMSPSLKSDGYILTKAQNATIRDSSISGWIQIKFDDSKMAWIQVAE